MALGDYSKHTWAESDDITVALLQNIEDKVDEIDAATIAGQIKFPATQNPSSDANTLDDYEEGVFTPTIFGATSAGSGTYTTQVGAYTKIGNVVHFRLFVVITNHTGSGKLYLGGLPFAAANWTPVTLGYVAGLTFSGNNLMAYIDGGGATYIKLGYAVNGAAFNLIDLDTTCEIMIAGSYTI